MLQKKEPIKTLKFERGRKSTKELEGKIVHIVEELKMT